MLHDDGSVRVEQRPYRDSPLMELRGHIRLRATLNEVMALLRDAQYNAQWVYRSGGAEILEQPTNARAYVYGVVDAPWPMQDRDTAVRFDFAQDASTRVIRIEITNTPDIYPEQASRVRVPDFGGFWQLTPLSDGWVEVIYQVRGDPGGWVPVWLANHAAQVSVTKTLQQMPVAVDHYRGRTSAGVMD